MRQAARTAVTDSTALGRCGSSSKVMRQLFTVVPTGMHTVADSLVNAQTDFPTAAFITRRCMLPGPSSYPSHAAASMGQPATHHSEEMR
jgi:hypothetical protein